MKMYLSKYVIWEMDVGHTFTLLREFRLGSTGVQKFF